MTETMRTPQDGAPAPPDPDGVAGLILAPYRSGDLWLDGPNTTVFFDHRSAREAARERLLEICRDYGADAVEALRELHPSWPVRRCKALAAGSEPTDREVAEDAALLLEDDQEGRYVLSGDTIPVTISGVTLAWAAIHEAGILLDREWAFLGLFRTEEAAREALKARFD